MKKESWLLSSKFSRGANEPPICGSPMKQCYDAAELAIETLRTPPVEGTMPYYTGTVIDQLFPPAYTVLPQTNQLYELDLAYGEFKSLDRQSLIERGAYFKAVEQTLVEQKSATRSRPG